MKLVESLEGFILTGSAADGEAGLALCRKCPPDLLLLDLQLPGLDGLELAELLQREQPDIRVMALTSRQDDFAITRIMEGGFAGYVEKDQPIGVLTEAMVTIGQGGVVF